MAETDRLKEIEKWLDDPDASGFYADLRYLIARVRELEADKKRLDWLDANPIVSVDDLGGALVAKIRITRSKIDDAMVTS